MTQRQRSHAKPVGVTHFLIDQEKRAQQAVPARSDAKRQGPTRFPVAGKRAKPIAEAVKSDEVDNGSGSSVSKAGKGGRSSGSRAGLLSRGQSDRGRKGRKPHPLDLL